ncbi:Echinoderm microtubule-associated protein-like 6, partial [Lobulomyces angularis]
MSNQPCGKCNKTVYPVEKQEAGSKSYHKGCFKCSDTSCGIQLTLKTFTIVEDNLYCQKHKPVPTATAVADSINSVHVKNVPKKSNDKLYVGEKPTIGLDAMSNYHALHSPKKSTENLGNVQKGGNNGSIKNLYQQETNNARPGQQDNLSQRRSSQTSSYNNSNTSNSTTSFWRQNNYNGTVICSVEILNQRPTTAKFLLRKDNVNIQSFDTIAPNGTFARILTCSMRDVLKDLPANYSQYDVNIKKFPDCSENVGCAVNILGRSDVMIQIHASSEVDRVYNCSILMSEAHQNPVKHQQQQISSPTSQNTNNSINNSGFSTNNYNTQQSRSNDTISQPISSAKNNNSTKNQTNILNNFQQASNTTSINNNHQNYQQAFNSVSTTDDDLLGGYDESEDTPVNNGSDEDGGTRAIKKSWKGNLIAPTNPPIAQGTLPKETLVLEHVYGYRIRDTRNNLFYTKNNLVVYPAGAVGVVHNVQTNTQTFFYGRHKEDITALALHPNGKTVATGDVVTHDDGCFVYIWDAENPADENKTIQFRIGEKKLARGVSDIEFSADGKYMTVVGMDDDHTIYIYDWEKSNKPLTKAKGHNDS